MREFAVYLFRIRLSYGTHNRNNIYLLELLSLIYTVARCNAKAVFLHSESHRFTDILEYCYKIEIRLLTIIWRTRDIAIDLVDIFTIPSRYLKWRKIGEIRSDWQVASRRGRLAARKWRAIAWSLDRLRSMCDVRVTLCHLRAENLSPRLRLATLFFGALAPSEFFIFAIYIENGEKTRLTRTWCAIQSRIRRLFI